VVVALALWNIYVRREFVMESGIKEVNEKQCIVFSRFKYYLSSSLLVVVDYVAIFSSVYVAGYVRDCLMHFFYGIYPPLILNNFFAYGVIPCMFLFFIAYTELYAKRLPTWEYIGRIFKVCLYVNVLILIFTYFLGKAESISRLFLVLLWLESFVNLCLFRYVSKKVLLNFGLWQIPILIIGAGKTAEILIDTFENEPGIGYEIIGLVEDHSKERILTQKYPMLGSFKDIEKIIEETEVQDVILATPGVSRKQLVQLIYRIQSRVRNLTIVPDLFGIPMSNVSVDSFYNQKTLVLHLRNNLARKRNRILKRVFDFMASLIGTILIAPILIIIAFLIYKSSPGSIIFSHMRIGTNGKVFPCYKFRSMVNNSQEMLSKYLEENAEAREEWNRDFKLKNDPRVTTIGEFLRKTSLDELPQLFNVIKGEMSLVGPRPIIDKEIEKYGEYINDYYLVRPGMTGYWQVSGRSDVDYKERVQMDSWYVRNWSLWQDLVLLVKTIGVVFGGKGAY
jgi:undecaprenyl-phosphate galactose phosphotransferase